MLPIFLIKNQQKFHAFWKDEHDLLLEKDAQGFCGIDAGPLTMGYRLNNPRTGGVTRRLIYPKGTYVLHMLRMMMFDRRSRDQNFKEMMQDFVKTYSGSAATTEDFKAMVEKHMTADMTAIAEGSIGMERWIGSLTNMSTAPRYPPSGSTTRSRTAGTEMSSSISKSPSPTWMTIPACSFRSISSQRTAAWSAWDALVWSEIKQPSRAIKGLKDKPRRALLNYMDDVLASN